MNALRSRIKARSEVDAHGCWIWKGNVGANGYGKLSVNGKEVAAHRAAFEAFNGAIPAGLSVCHRCDNPRCVNPQHLWTGTHSENLADMKAKGRARAPRGERCKSAKLVPEQVRAIRADTRGARAVAADYGINETTVSNIRACRRWRHVD